MKTMTKVMCGVVLLTSVLVVTGCADQAQTGALAGGVVGAGLGQAIGHDTGSTLIGAGVGTVGGYIVGNEMDKSKTQQEQAATAEAANTYVVNVHNSNGSISPVRLTRSGNMWLGPRGESYTSLPTESQLRPVYGF